jgi:Tfp pilus assembly protein PilX
MSLGISLAIVSIPVLPIVVLVIVGYKKIDLCESNVTVCYSDCENSLNSYLATLTIEQQAVASGTNSYLVNCQSECDSSYSCSSGQTYDEVFGAAILGVSALFLLVLTFILLAQKRLRDKQERHASSKLAYSKFLDFANQAYKGFDKAKKNSPPRSKRTSVAFLSASASRRASYVFPASSRRASITMPSASRRGSVLVPKDLSSRRSSVLALSNLGGKLTTRRRSVAAPSSFASRRQSLASRRASILAPSSALASRRASVAQPSPLASKGASLIASPAFVLEPLTEEGNEETEEENELAAPQDEGQEEYYELPEGFDYVECEYCQQWFVDDEIVKMRSGETKLGTLYCLYCDEIIYGIAN